MKPGGLHCARVVPQKARPHLRLIYAGIEEKREDFHAFDLNLPVHGAIRSAANWSVDVETIFEESLNLSDIRSPKNRRLHLERSFQFFRIRIALCRSPG